MGSRWEIAAVGCLHLDVPFSGVILTVMLMMDLNTLIGDRRCGDVLGERSRFRNRIVDCELLQQRRTDVGRVYCHHVNVVCSSRGNVWFVDILGIDGRWKR